MCPLPSSLSTTPPLPAAPSPSAASRQLSLTSLSSVSYTLPPRLTPASPSGRWLHTTALSPQTVQKPPHYFQAQHAQRQQLLHARHSLRPAGMRTSNTGEIRLECKQPEYECDTGRHTYQHGERGHARLVPRHPAAAGRAARARARRGSFGTSLARGGSKCKRRSSCRCMRRDANSTASSY